MSLGDGLAFEGAGGEHGGIAEFGSPAAALLQVRGDGRGGQSSLAPPQPLGLIPRKERRHHVLAKLTVQGNNHVSTAKFIC